MERKGKFLICAAAIGALSVGGLLGYTAIKNNKQFFDTTPVYAVAPYSCGGSIQFGSGNQRYTVDYNKNEMIVPIDDYTKNNKPDVWYIKDALVKSVVADSNTYICNGILKLAKSSGAGTLTITCNQNVQGGVLWAAGYNNKRPEISIGDTSVTITNGINGTSESGIVIGYPFMFTTPIDNFVITVPSGKQAWIADIAFRI